MALYTTELTQDKESFGFVKETTLTTFKTAGTMSISKNHLLFELKTKRTMFHTNSVLLMIILDTMKLWA
ncbi:hypothetical protein RIR_jg503.t1 [Rhizophagus irregularis DAOM 181602=DAOM 197198]|nr:hypothetical protein RIR_jg503.t1 [Rhizophagus irregularis DAOM 181602=DAOM 197198]